MKKQTIWALADKYTNKITAVYMTRVKARKEVIGFPGEKVVKCEIKIVKGK